MNAQQPQGQPGQGRTLRIPMDRPEQIQNLEILSDSDKEKYERGIRDLWHTMKNPSTLAIFAKPPKRRLQQMSRAFVGQNSNVRRRAQQRPDNKKLGNKTSELSETGTRIKMSELLDYL